MAKFILKRNKRPTAENVRRWYKLNPPRGFIVAYKSTNKSSERTKVYKNFVHRKLRALYYYEVKRTSRERLLIKQKYNRLSKIPYIVPTNGINR